MRNLKQQVDQLQQSVKESLPIQIRGGTSQLLSIDTMLSEQPPRKEEQPSGVGITDEALVAWERMGALKLEKIAEDAKIMFDDTRTEYREWDDE